MSTEQGQTKVKKLAKNIEEAIDRFERETASQVSAIRLTRQTEGGAKIMIYLYER
jgi:hypothetical protein